MNNQTKLTEPAQGYLSAEFFNPPINLIDPDSIRELSNLITRLDNDPDVKVIVFSSGAQDFFLAHFDVLTDKELTAAMDTGPTGMHPWLDVWFG
jgi:enoyl-CoA hydratase/carnithine racemase